MEAIKINDIGPVALISSDKLFLDRFQKELQLAGISSIEFSTPESVRNQLGHYPLSGAIVDQGFQSQLGDLDQYLITCLEDSVPTAQVYPGKNDFLAKMLKRTFSPEAFINEFLEFCFQTEKRHVRKEPRLEARLPFDVFSSFESETKAQAQSENISPSGLQISCPDDLSALEEVYLRIPKLQASQYKMRGKIVWTGRLNDPKSSPLYGIKLHTRDNKYLELFAKNGDES